MTAVKICGVTDAAAAVLSAELGAAWLGLNFWPGSPRCLDLEQARAIAAAVRAAAPRVALVGVFVNPTAGAVAETAAAVGLDLLQFSGDEPPAAVRAFAPRAIKALRSHDETAAAAYAGCWALLLDAPTPAWGGTGREWDYAAAAEFLAAGDGRSAGRRVFLAGGIRPANVRRLVATLRPFAVDVCSGVESAPGKKDPELLRQLFQEVRDGQVQRPA
jgi:phosphoribosylanthranilate isomerase